MMSWTYKSGIIFIDTTMLVEEFETADWGPAYPWPPPFNIQSSTLISISI